MKSRRVLFGACILAAVAGVIVFVLSTAPAVPAPSSSGSSDQPLITWTERRVQVGLAPGYSTSKDVGFSASIALDNVLIEPVPKLTPFVTIQPSTFATVPGGETRSVRLSFFVPEGTPLGTNEGTIHLRQGEKTLPQTLKVSLLVFSPYGPMLAAQAQRSSLVLIGTVVAQEPRPINGGTVTVWRVTPTRFLRGVVQGDVFVRWIGGYGQVRLDVGEEVLLVLKGPDAWGHYRVTGDPQAAFHIEYDPVRGRLAVIDPAYRGSDSETPQDPALTGFLKRSEQGLITLDEAIRILGFTP